MTLTLVKSEAYVVPDLSCILATQKEFHEAFHIPLNEDMQELYVKLVDEEHEEWIEEYYSQDAPAHKELKELADVLYTTAGLAYQLGYRLDVIPKLPRRTRFDDSITDYVSDVVTSKMEQEIIGNLVYSLFAFANSQGWDLLEAYMRVHKSNMSKLDAEGNPIFREDGKVLKGPNYQQPYLKDLTHEEDEVRTN